MTVQTLPFKNLIDIDRSSAIPVFRQVANGVIDLIRNGKIRPGYQLPASREMATIMKLNRTTVVAAYDELRVQGWVEVVGKRGMFISRQLPVIKPKVLYTDHLEDTQAFNQTSFYREIGFSRPPSLDLKPYQLLINDGYPDQRIAPLESILNRYKALLYRSSLHGMLMKESSSGSSALRSELAVFLSATRALNIEKENVLVTHGAQFAIFIAASMILKLGSTVIVGDLNYILADKVFEQLGANLIKVKVDENGIDVDAIETICNTSPPDLLYIIPHHHHPTTVTLSAERRLKLLDLIRRYKFPVIEDDYDYDFHYENSPILPLASADHKGYVLYIGSISKTLAPTIRIGYMVGNADFISQASKFKQLVEIRGDVVFEESVAHLFNTGEMQRHIRRSVKLYHQRRNQFCNLLKASMGDISHFTTPQGGMAVWVTFDKDYSIPDLAKRLASKGIYMNDGSLYKYSDSVNGMRLGFASLNDEEMLKFARALGEVK
ncbi:PLP-dependent aminotransferase family protein [Desertivirga xinjiangensis]|uniref:aminotransferase-like domain-containing protein n=1 Tax=Desertivirga xinjiangensis TaxID=539206 RepID=UPI00210E19C8|nr:PLP-dependent aminotransferase family protein [Pedobacter xinjiangensis]